ncbi:hypothetical protein HID58_041562, partial [Brassica napus]
MLSPTRVGGPPSPTFGALKQLSNKPYSKVAEPQHSSGFMRDARRTGYSHHRPSPREHHFETSHYEENRRPQRLTSRQRQESSFSHHSQTSRQLSTHISGIRLPQPVHSHHKDPLAYADKGRWEEPETRASTLQKVDQRGEGVYTSSARPPRSTVPPPPIEQTIEFNKAFIEAREELREFMIQYSSCSAARKERMRLTEEKGKAEEVARNMVAASKALNAQILNDAALNVNAISTRTHALARLGPPSADPNNDDLNLSTERIPTKKRLGRPPLARSLPKPLGVKPGAETKKVRRVPI